MAARRKASRAEQEEGGTRRGQQPSEQGRIPQPQSVQQVAARRAIEDPLAAGPEAVLQLQGKIGNQATGQLIAQTRQSEGAAGAQTGKMPEEVEGPLQRVSSTQREMEEDPIQGEPAVQRQEDGEAVQTQTAGADDAGRDSSLAGIYEQARAAVGDPESEEANWGWFDEVAESQRQPLEQAIRRYIGELVGERQIGPEGSTELAQFEIHMEGRWQGGHGVLVTPSPAAVLAELYQSGPDPLKAKIAHEVGHGAGGIEGEKGRLGVMNRIGNLREASNIRATMARMSLKYPDDYDEKTWSEEVRADLTGYYLESRAAHRWLDIEERYGHLRDEVADREHPPGAVRLAIMHELPVPFR